ncbi:dTDP-4-dehydrorhamnose 3,5-epimerase [Dechloromonas sp. ZS-1]|uniref:dTDP-4-dehydrorhamnose 3,5-epimerase n=1 Tax=Dechloromonas sp. ZS-1 TaxID=3138067 RepID=UPI0031FDC45C
MQTIETGIAGLLILEPRVFGDARGFFYESYNRQVFAAATGLDIDFVQDNHSRSSRGVLRGLHYQLAPHAQGKLVRVVHGAVLDVAVDIRPESPTCGQHVAVELSADNKRMFWIPPGFAHGFLTLSETAEFLYKTTDYYAPAAERCIRWDDPQLAIEWSLGDVVPQLSVKDQQGMAYADALQQL